MTIQEFKQSLAQSSPPAEFSLILKSLWYDGKGDWTMSHDIAQDIQTNEGSWVHAYLHRKEGDEGNAAYWYRRAGKPFPKQSLEEEWEALVEKVLT